MRRRAPAKMASFSAGEKRRRGGSPIILRIITILRTQKKRQADERTPPSPAVLHAVVMVMETLPPGQVGEPDASYLFSESRDQLGDRSADLHAVMRLGVGEKLELGQ
jgi:hypothetical protein